MDDLGRMLRDKRAMTGLSQVAAADLLGIRNTHLSQLETGKIGTPDVALRRRIADFLGVSHLDVLIASGEISEEEVQSSGRAGVVRDDPTSPAHELHALIDQINWYGRPERVLYLKGLLDSMVAVDRQYKEEV